MKALSKSNFELVHKTCLHASVSYKNILNVVSYKILSGLSDVLIN